MGRNPPDERLVYLSLKNVFKGANAGLRQPKKIRKLVQEHQDQADTQDLIREHNIDNVCNAARTLLEERVFESTVFAKMRFPEVFGVSPAQSADREASEAEATRMETDALKEAVERRPEKLETASPNEGESVQKGKGECSAISLASDDTQKPNTHTRASESAPSLYPIYLPMKSQHILLSKVQAIMESACFAFGQKHLPKDMQAREWDCAEAAELNCWHGLLLRNQQKLSRDRLSELRKPLDEILASTNHLRHTAVHRLRVTAGRIEQFVLDCQALAGLLEDDVCAARLARLRLEIHATVDELGRNKDLLESRLSDTLKRLAAQRIELDRLEREAVKSMLTENTQYQVLAGANLERAISTPQTIEHSAPAMSDNETGSEVDVDTLGTIGEDDLE